MLASLAVGNTKAGGSRTAARLVPVPLRTDDFCSGSVLRCSRTSRQAAGETAVIPYEVKTVNFHGIIRKTIQLTFKNATAEKETIVIQANVTTDMSINPRYVNFRNLSLNPDTTYTEFFEIENGSENSLAVTRIFSENAALKVTPAEVTIPPGKSHLIRLEFIPNKAGRQNAKVVIETNNPRVSSQNLSVFINVKENKAARSE